MKKAIVILSGGVDSSVLLYMLAGDYDEVRAITFDYGQRHGKEIDAAVAIAGSLPVVDHRVIEIAGFNGLAVGSSQTDRNVDVPEGHYTDASMRATVVPNRNMVMLSIAATWAIATGSEAVAYGAHAGDHAIYPDCRAPFVRWMNAAIEKGNFTATDSRPGVEVIAPFMHLSKANIVSIGKTYRVPFHLTWSCYKGGAQHCGRCGTCVERLEAFRLAGMHDPVEYEGDASPGMLAEVQV